VEGFAKHLEKGHVFVVIALELAVDQVSCRWGISRSAGGEQKRQGDGNRDDDGNGYCNGGITRDARGRKRSSGAIRPPLISAAVSMQR